MSTRAPFITRASGEWMTWVVTLALVTAGSVWPEPDVSLARQVAGGLLALAPAVAVAALLAGAMTLGSWADKAMPLVRGNPARAIVMASVAGALTPVCGLGVLPLIAALLQRGLPLAPVMAFWVSSPVMGPSMVVVTIAVLGVPFAAAKALAAFGVGMLAGCVVHLLPGRDRSPGALMRPGALDRNDTCPVRFWAEAWRSARLVLRWLALALVLEILLQRLLPGEWISAAFGAGNAGSVPLAAIIGAPLYVDGYAALPMVRGLMEMGMSFGAALAFMISGASVSLYAAVAVAALVRARVFALYVLLAVVGAMLAGLTADWLVGSAT